MAAMVWMPSQDCECAIKLLGCYDGCKFVRQGNTTKRDDPCGGGKSSARPAVGWADGENDLLGSVVLKRAQGCGELLGGDLLTAAIGEEKGGAGAGGRLGDEVQQGGLGRKRAHRGGGVAGGAVKVES